MVNCNPETVSTDYDTSDRLYFEPLTLEDVLEIVDKERPFGVIVQYGGQTPLKLARDLEAAGVPIIGTTPDSIDLAEDRERFQQLIHELGLLQPPNTTARSEDEAVSEAAQIGYPLVVRPSYVLGGRAMEIVYDEADLRRYMREAVRVSNESPVLLDRFLDDAIEVDVDAICDGEDVLIGGIMEHIEQAGVHSGDSACSLPPYTLSPAIQDRMRDQMAKLAHALKVVGLMNAQFAIKDEEVYILEVNPRASRTVPFVSKAIGVPLAKVAARCMVGVTLEEQGLLKERKPKHYFVKEAVFPFIKFPRRRHRAGAGDEVHRRGHGRRRELRRGLRQGPGRGRDPAPAQGQGHAQRTPCGQGPAGAGSARSAGSRLQAVRHPRHRGGGSRGGHSMRRRQQGRRGPASHRRHDQEQRDQLHRQHDRRRAGHRRLGGDSARRPAAQGELYDDHIGRGGDLPGPETIGCRRCQPVTGALLTAAQRASYAKKYRACGLSRVRTRQSAAERGHSRPGLNAHAARHSRRGNLP